MELDERKLISSGLNPTMYVTLYAIYRKKENIIQYIKNLQIFERVIESLEKSGYVKIIGPDKTKDFILRKKAISLLGENDVSEWYEEWRNLFPKGINAGGYHYRGNKGEILKKLSKFVENNPEYTKEQIMQATSNYINRMMRSGSYMMLAHYFIDKKDVGSSLLTELENLETRTEESTPLNRMI